VSFQSTRPCGARPITSFLLSNPIPFQSTRPCGARLCVIRSFCSHITVSIHAPVRGATNMRVPTMASIRRFNPRARAGRDNMRVPTMASIRRFNPRARAGRDQRRPSLQFHSCVSIHAPVRGATREVDVDFNYVEVFQSTRPCGARPRVIYVRPPEHKFQSTRPCGARPFEDAFPSSATSFQSTRPCGARLQIISL